LFDSKIGTSESDEADLLALLVDEYENNHYPIH
jgi:HTH-type transcriptional regulator/antitoxin HigA